MATWFRLWEKKRGDRRTGSPVLASWGEGAFFAAMFFAGAVALGAVIAAYCLQVAEAQPYLDGWSFWFVVGVLGALIVIGGAGLVYTLLRSNTSIERRAALAKEAASLRPDPVDVPTPLPADILLPTIPGDDLVTDSPGIALAYRLPIAEQPGWRVLPALLFCILWNLAAGILVASAFASGVSPIFTSVVIGFVVIGLGSIFYLVAELREAAVLGPTVLEISDHPLLPGRQYEIYLSQTGRQRLQRLDVLLVCDEEATYSHGTDVRTETRRVHEQPLTTREGVELSPGNALESGGSFEAPAGMHSFQSEHNGVQWRLLVRGVPVEAEVWERYFPIVLHPALPASE